MKKETLRSWAAYGFISEMAIDLSKFAVWDGMKIYKSAQARHLRF